MIQYMFFNKLYNYLHNNYYYIIILVTILTIVISYIIYSNNLYYRYNNMLNSSKYWNKINIILSFKKLNKQKLIEVKNFSEKNNNIYGIFTLLNMAYQESINNRLNNAKKYLVQALKKSNDNNIKEIINLRIQYINKQLKLFNDVNQMKIFSFNK